MPRARLKKILERAEDIKDGHENKKESEKRRQEPQPPPKVKMVCTVPLPVWN